MIGGCPAPTLKHKDLDLHRSFGTVGDRPVFPAEFNTDAGLFGNPSQSAEGQPFGCTNYSQSALSTDLTGTKRDPAQLEIVTRANARGGLSVRESLDIARKQGLFRWYYNIQAYAPLDQFDALRYAQLMGVNLKEFRSISLGWPWFDSWQNAIAKGQFVMPMPTPEEIVAITKSSDAFGWHNWECTGWKSVYGSTVLKCKSWQGPGIGEGGVIYFPREVVNVVQSLKYSVAYTPTMLEAPSKLRIPLGIFDTLISLIRNFPLSWHY